MTPLYLMSYMTNFFPSITVATSTKMRNAMQDPEGSRNS